MPTLSLRPRNATVFDEKYVTDRTRPGASAPYDEDYSTYRAAWDAQETIYARCWEYWSGDIFDKRRHEPTPGNPKGERYYPLRINEVRRAVIIHALNIFGLTNEEPYLTFEFKPKRTTVEVALERAKRLGEMAEDWFEDCGGEDLFREQARIFMILGGAVLKVRPDSDSPFGVVVENGSLRHFFPIWHPTRYNKLLRCYFKFEIDRDVARELYGYTARTDEQLYFLETWTKETWAVHIGTPGKWQLAVDPQSNVAYEGPNDCIDPLTGQQEIPVIYIPRIRTGAYYGENLPDEIRGLQDEINARMADTGDAVAIASRMHVVGSDISRRRQAGDRLRLPNDPLEIFDLGDTIAGQEQPKAYTLDGPAPGEGTLAHNVQLDAKLYDLAGIPDVMRGRVDGTQRSGEALSALAFPSLAMINEYRASFRAGIKLSWRHYMAMSYRMGINKLSLEDFGHKMKLKFAPVLPRDTSLINDTIAIQRSAGAMSTRRAVSLSPDVTNIEEELQLIEEEEAAERAFQQAQANLKARQNQSRRKPNE
jgi:hypothetical protein